MSYWKELVRKKAARDSGLPTGYLGRDWGMMDREDLVNVIYILHAENEKLKKEVHEKSFDAFMKEVKKTQ